MTRSCRSPLTVTVGLVLGLCVFATSLPVHAGQVHLIGPPGARVSIDGHDLGMLPLSPRSLPAGVYEVQCKARGYEPLTQSVLVPEGDAMVHLRLRPLALSRNRALTGSLLYAGLGQWYSGARLRGWAYFTGKTVGLLTALTGELGRSTREADYTNALRTYQQAVEPDQIAFWRRQTDQAYQDLTAMEDLRNTGLLLAGGAWLLSLLDAWLLFPSVDIGSGPVPPAATMHLDRDPMRQGMHAAVTVAF